MTWTNLRVLSLRHPCAAHVCGACQGADFRRVRSLARPACGDVTQAQRGTTRIALEAAGGGGASAASMLPRTPSGNGEEDSPVTWTPRISSVALRRPSAQSSCQIQRSLFVEPITHER